MCSSHKHGHLSCLRDRCNSLKSSLLYLDYELVVDEYSDDYDSTKTLSSSLPSFQAHHVLSKSRLRNPSFDILDEAPPAIRSVLWQHGADFHQIRRRAPA